jgi:SAM-dependent methyltransferase
MQIVRTLKLIRRRIYCLRAFVPGLRRRHQLEELVGPLGFWDALQAYQLNAVMRLGLLPGHTMLDLGCGPLQGGEVFIKYLDPQRYVGVDHRLECIKAGEEQVARHRLADKKPVLLHSETFGEREFGPMTFDFIWASQILYYFDAPTMHRLFEVIAPRLNRDGIMAGDILGPSSDRSFLRPPFPPVHTVESLDAIAGDHGLRVVALGPIQDFGYPPRSGLRANTLLKINHRT